MNKNIVKTKLDNGLTVLLEEIHTAPIISQWVWYRVGSRNETKGITGISHWVEHMQFKGTERFPAGMLDKAISRDGGYWNAFTYMDWTAFFCTMPAEKINLAIELEADRMSQSLYLPEEIESERTVILSEREGAVNEPTFRLNEAVNNASFCRHPYRNEVIGSEEDLRHMSRNDLYDYYRSHYLPNNAVLAMAGDFDTETMLKTLEKVYQPISASPISLSIPTPEREIAQPQLLEVHGPSEVTFVKMAWRMPAGKHPDIYPITLLDSILTGPSSLNMFGGGGVGNKTSRLYKVLIESQIAAGFSGDYTLTIDPYDYTIMVIMNQGHDPQEAITQIDQEIKRIQDGDIRTEDIQKALKQARAMFAYSGENITNRAYWLGFTEMFDDYRWFDRFVPSLEVVSKADIQRVANQYFSPNHRVVGICTPEVQDEE